jgi:hypothetical protein
LDSASVFKEEENRKLILKSAAVLFLLLMVTGCPETVEFLPDNGGGSNLPAGTYRVTFTAPNATTLMSPSYCDVVAPNTTLNEQGFSFTTQPARTNWDFWDWKDSDGGWVDFDTTITKNITWIVQWSRNWGWRGLSMSSDGSHIISGRYGVSNAYLSTDSGVTFSSKTSKGSWAVPLMSSDGTKLVIQNYAFSYNPGVYYSTDSGTTWTKSADITNLYDSTPFCSNSDGSKIYFMRSRGNGSTLDVNIYTSTDFGQTWSSTTPAALQNFNEGGGYAEMSGFAVSGDGTKMVALYDGDQDSDGAQATGDVWYSTNSGSTWTRSSDTSDRGQAWGYAFYSPDGSFYAISYSGSNPYQWSGHLFKSTDNGNNWTEITNGLPDPSTCQIAQIAFNDTGSVMVLSAYESGLYQSIDSGATWSLVTGSDAGSTDRWISVAMSTASSPYKVAAVMENQNIFHFTINGGTGATTALTGCTTWPETAP